MLIDEGIFQENKIYGHKFCEEKKQYIKRNNMIEHMIYWHKI
jgi:hypothetical protein